MGGIVAGLGAIVGPWLKRVTPRAGMLGTLCGIALVFIGTVPLATIFEDPFIGFASMIIILWGLVGRHRLPFNIPAGLLALIVGTVVALGMIYSPGGGSVGIGFAVPSDMVQKIVADLEDDGEITRGWLGVQIKPLSEDAANVLGREAGKGVVIESVAADSPAAEAGLKPGDVVLRFGDSDITELRDLTAAVAANAPGVAAQIEVLRRGEEVTLDVTLGDRASQDA